MKRHTKTAGLSLIAAVVGAGMTVAPASANTAGGTLSYCGTDHATSHADHGAVDQRPYAATTFQGPSNYCGYTSTVYSVRAKLRWKVGSTVSTSGWASSSTTALAFGATTTGVAVDSCHQLLRSGGVVAEQWIQANGTVTPGACPF